MAKKATKKKAALACPHCGHAIKPELLQDQYSRRGRQRTFRMLCPVTECARIIEVRVKMTPTYSVHAAHGLAGI